MKKAASHTRKKKRANVSAFMDAGTDLLEAVAGWHRLEVRLQGEATLENVEAFVKSLAYGIEEFQWREWAKWLLRREQLPAPQDAVERPRRPEINGRIQLPHVEGDSPASQLQRVFQRFHPNSAEAWAARIEWHFLTDTNPPKEVARFIGALRVATLQEDADEGRKFRDRKGRPAKARAQAEAWLRSLPKREGERWTNTGIAEYIRAHPTHFPGAKDLGAEAIRKRLPPVKK